MSTRATGYFDVFNPLTKKTTTLAKIYIGHDAYPLGFGHDILTKISKIKDPIRNAEHLILILIKNYESGLYFSSNEYVYTFTLVTPTASSDSFLPGDYIDNIIVTSDSYDKAVFNGDYDQFKKFVNFDDFISASDSDDHSDDNGDNDDDEEEENDDEEDDEDEDDGDNDDDDDDGDDDDGDDDDDDDDDDDGDDDDDYIGLKALSPRIK
jgi:hypothetical protein